MSGLKTFFEIFYVSKQKASIQLDQRAGWTQKEPLDLVGIRR
jgi:hypothetical protein